MASASLSPATTKLDGGTPSAPASSASASSVPCLVLCSVNSRNGGTAARGPGAPCGGEAQRASTPPASISSTEKSAGTSLSLPPTPACSGAVHSVMPTSSSCTKRERQVARPRPALGENEGMAATVPSPPRCGGMVLRRTSWTTTLVSRATDPSGAVPANAAAPGGGALSTAGQQQAARTLERTRGPPCVHEYNYKIDYL
jgi:hypothetical protein